MSLRGPHFLRGAEGPGHLRCRPDGSPDHLLLTLGSRTGMKYSSENLGVVSQYFCPSYLSFSSPLCWDPSTKQYCCVLNDTKLVTWDGEENHLEKVSSDHTIQLKSKAIDILSSENQCHVVFENGSVQTISYLTQKKKMAIEDNVLPPGAVIKHSKLFSEAGLQYLSHIFDHVEENGGKSKTDIILFRVTVDPETQQTRLYHKNRFQFPDSCKSVQAGDGPIGFFISKDAVLHSVDLRVHGDTNVKQLLQVTKQSSTRPMHVSVVDGNHLSVLGDEVDGDGSIISIINVSHGIIVANQKIKAVARGDDTSGVVNGADGQLLFKHGQRVASILIQDLPSNLSELVGTQMTNPEPVQLTFDENDTDLPSWEVVGALSQPVQLYQILPNLLMSFKVVKLNQLIKDFTDIPELLLLNIIETYINAPTEKFAKKSSPAKEHSRQEPEERRQDFLSNAFKVPISDVLMVQHLRQLDFATAKKILSFLIESVVDSSSEEDEKFFEQILMWISMLLNAHYCNYVLSKEEESVEQLNKALDVVKKLEECLHDIGSTLPLIKMITQQQLIRPAVSQKMYNIELVDL